MPSVFKNILAVIAGLVIGSFVNMGIIMVSGSVIPPPDGADLTTTEGLTAAMHLMGPQHFFFPFLAHALGTFVGSLIAATIAATYKTKIAFGIGVFFLVGGLAMVFVVPSPTWFIIVDLVGAYLPMAWIAGKIVDKS